VRRRPAGLVSFTVALIGVGISAYLTVEHYDTKLVLACPESATINCAKVTTSQWSHLGPIPVAVLGLVFFVAMTLLCCPPVWQVRALDPVRVAAAAVGTVSALYLVWIELFRVNAICLWCTGAHVCAIALLAAILWHVSETTQP
jgi:uncharacterized membrane protein